jgi:hypothetical protein
MTSTDTPRIRVSRPGELIETIPYLLGFHPKESLVLLGFNKRATSRTRGSEVQIAIRVDLPDCDPSAADFSPVISALLQVKSTEAVPVIYAESPEVDGAPADPRDCWAELARSICAALNAAGIAAIDALAVSETHWWSLMCRVPTCCPPEGTVREVGCSEAAAHATLAGMVALPDREALAGQLTGRSRAERDKLEPQLAAAEHRLVKAALDDRIGRLLRSDATALFSAARVLSAQASSSKQSGPRPLTPSKIARFGVALADIAIRDKLWLAVDERSLDAKELMSQLHTRLPAPYDAGPMFLFGWQHWRAGNGTLAAMAAERALESDPGYSAARLLFEAVQAGLDPRTTPMLGETVRPERRRRSPPPPPA